jgi:hypothetical protein
MAKLFEDIIVLKLSKLVKDNDSDTATSIVTDDLTIALEQVVQELAGEGVLVEIEKA